MSSNASPTFPSTAVAVIGMAGRFPRASDLDAFWGNLRDGVEAVTFFTDDELREAGVPDETLANPHYVKARGVLEDTDRFDASFFNYSVKQAQVTEPQIRLFLEKCWEAMESAGYDPILYEGAVGVYGGASAPSYLLYHLLRDRNVVAGANRWTLNTYNNNDYLTTHASFRMGLRGPSVNVQTACSTSLVAVHQAVQALLAGECSIALAGGVSVFTPGRRGYLYEEGHILSPDGHCRAFDADAQGTLEGEGVGVVALKRLDQAQADGDPVLAVILSTAINNDGKLKVGFTAPSIDGQADVITEAQAVAGVSPDDITCIEAHGTGTALGDPIEIAALKQAFRGGTTRTGYCAIGAAKTAIGHLDAAAGIAGFIKMVLQLQHRQIAPVLHFQRPNPKLEIEDSPFFINGRLRDWQVPDGAPRRAGVSSFGIGGTNAHAILQEAPAPQPSGPARPYHLLILSAMTESARETMTQNLIRWLEANPEANMADVAFTLQAGRKFFRQRRTVLCRDREDALDALRTMDPLRVQTRLDPHRMTPTVFMFPGQGAQHVGMARELYGLEPVFRETVDHCCELLRPHLGGLDLREVIHPAEGATEEAAERLKQTALTQPALFVVEYALAKQLQHWGYAVEAMLGHSIGEYVAACLANVFSLEDALRLVAARGALMQEMPAGAMLSVSLPEAELRQLLPDWLDLAAVNGPALCVVAGPAEAVDAFQAELEGREVHCQRLHTSHAFHSRMMDPIVARFEEVVQTVELRRPEVAYLSNVTGTWITEEEARDPGYWARHLRGTVRFDDGLRELMKEPERILLEVGPGRSLTTLARRHPVRDPKLIVANLLPHVQDGLTETQTLWSAVAEMWLEGLEPKWPRLYEHQRRHRVPLPTYPFERGRFWLGVQDEEAEKSVVHWSPDHQHYPTPLHFEPRNEYEEIMCDIFRELFGLQKVSIYHNFFHLGGDSLLAVQMVSRIRERCKVEVPLRTVWELRTVAQFALAVAEYRQKQGVPQEAIRADRDAAREFTGEVDLGVDALSDDEVEAMLAELGEETELTA